MTVFGGCFDTDDDFRTFNLQVTCCRFQIFAVLHFAFYMSSLTTPLLHSQREEK